jgi:hypothetical protein
MTILRLRYTKLLNFKSSRSLLSKLFVCAARALLFEWRLEMGGVGIHDNEDRRMFFDPSQVSTTFDHGFYVRVR